MHVLPATKIKRQQQQPQRATCYGQTFKLFRQCSHNVRRSGVAFDMRCTFPSPGCMYLHTLCIGFMLQPLVVSVSLLPHVCRLPIEWHLSSPPRLTTFFAHILIDFTVCSGARSTAATPIQLPHNSATAIPVDSTSCLVADYFPRFRFQCCQIFCQLCQMPNWFSSHNLPAFINDTMWLKSVG